ncbi:hypothetical protein HJC23_005712 [Cyclotella cryptica]|uniref:Pentacotripeptide-repeat region of PRORP domain-containing protein n=1 Tax=Cyclotella cryptica TaxID=29204 RepID=A0ABD3QEG5_9STRA
MRTRTIKHYQDHTTTITFLSDYRDTRWFPTEERGRQKITKGIIEDLKTSFIHTTIQLIMEWTKLWGKNRGSHHVSSEQVNRGVLLADELMDKVLEMTKTEIGTALQCSKQLNEDLSPSVFVRNDAIKNSKELDIEICCQMIALGWSRCDPRGLLPLNAAQKAQTILDRLEEICHMFGRLPKSETQKLSFTRQDVTPTTRLYNHVLSCWSRSLHSDAENQVRRLLCRMASSDGAFSMPDTISYNNLLHLYANKGDFEKAEALLRQMEKPSVKPPSSSNTPPTHQFQICDEITADVFSYSIVINALRKRFVSGGLNRDMDDPVRAERILMQMVKKGVMPNEVCYSTVLSLYAVADRLVREELSNPKSRKWKNIGVGLNNIGWGAENAERVLDWMIDLYEREGQDGQGARVQINSQHFTTVIDAWAKAGKGIDGAKHCERLCDRLVSLYEKCGEEFLRPRPECFGAVIDAWSKADEEYHTADYAEAVLDRMETYFLPEKLNKKFMLSNVAYNLEFTSPYFLATNVSQIVIDAWSRRSGKDAAERAENTLHRMLRNYELTNNKSLRPDVISYTALMKSYVNRPNGGDKALELLREMDKQYRDGNTRAKADAQAISIAIDACVKSGLLDEALSLLDDVEDSKKNRVMFNTLISAYKLEGRGEKAEVLLRRMDNLSKAGYRSCSPDSTSYAMCIYAWGASEIGTSQQRLERARLLFDESITRYCDGDELLKPSSSHFNTLAYVIASSDNPDKDLLVLSLFQDMEKLGCEPCIVTFNILIKACASIKGNQERKEKSLQIAASAFKSIKSAGLTADTITYTSMIHAVLNLTGSSSYKVNSIAGIFKMCCADGCLNQHIMNTLVDAMSKEEFAIITGMSNNNSLQIESLPPEWSSNSRTVSELEF